jgi:hypothetical protein
VNHRPVHGLERPTYPQPSTRCPIETTNCNSVAALGVGRELTLDRLAQRDNLGAVKADAAGIAYAATVARDGGRPEAYFAFDDEADARKFAAVLEADIAARYPDWASQRAFEMDGAKLRALEASLPLPQRDRRRDPPDGSSLRIRVRRGPRAPDEE